MFQEYLHAINVVEDRMKRIEAQIHEEALQSEHAPVIQALQTLRSVAEVTAVTLVAEIGQFSRFSSPKQLYYAGLVPKEYSSGSNRWQGSITKTGNSQVRRSIVEVCWSYVIDHLLKVNYLNDKKVKSLKRNVLLGKLSNVCI